MIFKHVLIAPAQAVFPHSFFFEENKGRDEPILVGVGNNGDIWYYDQEAKKWERAT